jgi:hypothetical protein
VSDPQSVFFDACPAGAAIALIMPSPRVQGEGARRPPRIDMGEGDANRPPHNQNCRESCRSRMSAIIPVEPLSGPSPHPSPRSARFRGRHGAREETEFVARARATLLPNKLHVLAETSGHNMRGKIAWGIRGCISWPFCGPSEPS